MLYSTFKGNYIHSFLCSILQNSRKLATLLYTLSFLSEGAEKLQYIEYDKKWVSKEYGSLIMPKMFCSLSFKEFMKDDNARSGDVDSSHLFFLKNSFYISIYLHMEN